jgi:hypothetical protein
VDESCDPSAGRRLLSQVSGVLVEGIAAAAILVTWAH